MRVIFFARYDASQYGFAYIEAGFLIKKLLSIGVAKTFGHSSSTREPSGVDVIFPARTAMVGLGAQGRPP